MLLCAMLFFVFGFKVAGELVTKFQDEIRNYLNLVVNKTQNDLGKCGPLSNVYSSLVVAGCNRVIDPFVSIKFNI